MSLWEFQACIEGWATANGAEAAPEAPSGDEFEAMVRRRAERDARAGST